MTTRSVEQRSLNDTVREFFASPMRMIIAYLAALTFAEVATTFLHPVLGIAAHALLLVMLLIHAAFVVDSAGFPILVSLLMAPLIRLLSLALPLFMIDQKFWYLIVSVPLFAACFVAMRLMRYSLHQVGFNFNHLPYQLITAFLGIAFGYVEFVILRPQPLVRDPSLFDLLFAAFALFIGTGLMEELLFRGVMQQAAEKTFGARGSLLFSAAVFTIMHIGWQSAIDLAFVFVAGMWWGYVFYRTRSIIGITLAHTLTNIMLFIVLPLAFPTDLRPVQSTDPQAATTIVSEAPVLSGVEVQEVPNTAVAPTTTIQVGSENADLNLENVLLILIIEIYLLLISILTLVTLVRRRRKARPLPTAVEAAQPDS